MVVGTFRICRGPSDFQIFRAPQHTKKHTNVVHDSKNRHQRSDRQLGHTPRQPFCPSVVRQSSCETSSKGNNIWRRRRFWHRFQMLGSVRAIWFMSSGRLAYMTQGSQSQIRFTQPPSANHISFLDSLYLAIQCSISFRAAPKRGHSIQFFGLAFSPIN